MPPLQAALAQRGVRLGEEAVDLLVERDDTHLDKREGGVE